MTGLSVVVLVYSPAVAESGKAAFDLSVGDKAHHLLWAGVFVAAGAVSCTWSFRIFRQEAQDARKQTDVLAGEGRAALRMIEATGPLTRR